MNSDRWAAVGAIAGVVGVVVTLFIYLDQRNSPAGGGINTTPSESPTAEYQEPTDPVNPIEETSNEGYSDTETTESEAGNEAWVQEWEEVWLYLVPTGTPDNCPSTAADFDEEVEDESTSTWMRTSGDTYPELIWHGIRAREAILLI